MPLNLRLSLYGITCLAGFVWPFYFIVKFAIQVKEGIITGSPIEIGQSFFNGAKTCSKDKFIIQEKCGIEHE